MILQSLRDMIGFSVRPVTPLAEWVGGGPPRLPLDEPADYAVATGTGAGISGAAAWTPPGPSEQRAHLRGVRRVGRTGKRWLSPLLTALVTSIQFPPGERVAVIGVAAIVAGPRITFLILLGWGLAAACLTLIGRIVRSVTR